MSLLAGSHPLMRYGFDTPIIPLTYSTHFCLYNRVLRVPVYVRAHVHAGTSEKFVPRVDEFRQDDSLADDDVVNPSAYRDWNKANPDEPFDLGHGLGSQMRRESMLHQHDVDVMTNVWPETPVMNRETKQVIEGKIVELGNDSQTRMMIVTNGPGFNVGEPIRFMGSKGPAIPHFSWTHVVRETATSLQMWGIILENARESVAPRFVSTDDLSGRLGFELMSNVKSRRGQRARAMNRTQWWN